MQSKLTKLQVVGILPFGPADPQPQYFVLRLSHPGWTAWEPGQFVMLRPDSFGLGLPLGRPFSICHMTARHLICFFRVVGKGTEELARVKPGDNILVWGPLGNGFHMEPDTPTLLLAGGMGIAPFVGYANKHPQPWNLSMVFGHRSPLSCYPVDSIKENIPVDTLQEQEPEDLDNLIYTLQERMKDCAEQNGLALACGPLPFLRTIKRISAAVKCKCQLSLENRMACGVGACLGCVQKPGPGWSQGGESALPLQVCMHGPVFWADAVNLD